MVGYAQHASGTAGGSVGWLGEFPNLIVTRTGNAQAVQTVEFTTVDGTAVTGGTSGAGTLDYATTAGTLTFNQGDTVKTFSVATIPDTVTEGNETFNVVLSNSVR